MGAERSSFFVADVSAGVGRQIRVVFGVEEFSAVAVVLGEGLAVLVVALGAFPAVDMLSLIFFCVDLFDPLPHAGQM